MSSVLDRDTLDAAAVRMLGDVRIDAVDVLVLAAARARRQRRRRRLATATALAGVAAALLLVGGGAVPGVALPQLRPAGTPTGPGQVPDLVRVPPPWTPSATDRPLSRVAYAVLDSRADYSGGPGRPVWLVGADDGAYRSLPAERPYRVAVSADGSRVTWVEQPFDDSGLGQQADEIRILDVRAGAVRSVPLRGQFGRGFAVVGTAFAPSGNRLLVWGSDRGPWFGDRADLVRVYEIDTGSAAPAARQVSIRPDIPPGGFATPAAGSLFDAAHPPAEVNDDDLDHGLPPGPMTQPPLVSPDGTTQYALAGAQFAGQADRGRELFRYTLVRWQGDDLEGRPVGELGVGTAAMHLGLDGPSVLVSMWTTESVLERGGTGPGKVLRVNGTGVRELSRSEGAARVIAASAGVVGSPGSLVVKAPGDRVAPLQATWYAWEVRRAAGWAGGLPWWMQVLAGAGFVALGLAVTRRRGHGPSPRTVTAAVTVVVAVVVAGSAVALVTNAAVGVTGRGSGAADAGAGAAVVMPAVLRDQHRLAPRAFDTPGEPRTRRVSAVFRATLGGRAGAFGLDGATGRTVSLDDLPGLRTTDGTGRWTVSPGGRYVASDAGVVDLETARVRQPRTALTGIVVRDDGSVAGLDPSGVLVLSSAGRERPYPSLQEPGTVVVAQWGTSVLVLIRPPDGSAERYDVVDLTTGSVSRMPPVVQRPSLPGLGPRGPLAPPLESDGSMRLIALSSDQRLVGVGPAVTGPVAILRIRGAGSTGYDPVTTVRVRTTEEVALAPDVVAEARPVAVDEPWWAGVADPQVEQVAGRALAAGIAALLLIGFLVALTRRPRPFTETGSFRDRLRGGAAAGEE